eukprot:4791806-Pleurochrysis_carterae.AAC.1
MFLKSASPTRIHRRHRTSRAHDAGAFEPLRFRSPTPVPVCATFLCSTFASFPPSQTFSLTDFPQGPCAR